MAKITLIGALARFTGGNTELEIEATTIKQLFRMLIERYPGLEPHLEEGVAVAIDGQIFQDSLLEAIEPNSEVHLLPQIGGG